jgi:hypothetical protein
MGPWKALDKILGLVDDHDRDREAGSTELTRLIRGVIIAACAAEAERVAAQEACAVDECPPTHINDYGQCIWNCEHP